MAGQPRHVFELPRITRLVIRQRAGPLGQPQFVLEQPPQPQPQHASEIGGGSGSGGAARGTASVPAALQLRLYAQRIPSRHANFLISQNASDFARPRGDRSSTCLVKVRRVDGGVRNGSGSRSSGGGGRKNLPTATASQTKANFRPFAAPSGREQPVYHVLQLRRANDHMPTRQPRAVVSFYGNALRVGVPAALWDCRADVRVPVSDSGGGDGDARDVGDGPEWDAALRAFRRMLVTGRENLVSPEPVRVLEQRSRGSEGSSRKNFALWWAKPKDAYAVSQVAAAAAAGPRANAIAGARVTGGGKEEAKKKGGSGGGIDAHWSRAEGKRAAAGEEHECEGKTREGVEGADGAGGGSGGSGDGGGGERARRRRRSRGRPDARGGRGYQAAAAPPPATAAAAATPAPTAGSDARACSPGHRIDMPFLSLVRRTDDRKLFNLSFRPPLDAVTAFGIALCRLDQASRRLIGVDEA